MTRSLPWLKKVCIYIPVGEGEGEGEHSTTVEPRCNERPRDWQNLLLWRGFVTSRFFFVYFTITETKKIFRNTEDFTYPCVAGAGLFFTAKEEISRKREGGACSGDPFFHFTPPPPPPQFNNVTALHQQTNRLTIWNWHRIASVAVSVELGRQHPGGQYKRSGDAFRLA